MSQTLRPIATLGVALTLAATATGCGDDGGAPAPAPQPSGECDGDDDCDDGRACTRDRCTDGTCEHVPRTGEPCDDGDACTEGTTCDADGVCAGGEPVEIPSDPCRSCHCDPDEGVICVARQEGASCDDGDCCTSGDACRACDPATGDCPEWGLTCSGDPVSCDDDEACTDDACRCEDGEAVCEHTPAPDGRSCDADPNDCTVGDTCQDGVCRLGEPAELSDGNPCTKDRCVKGEVVHEPLDGGDCDDGNICTAGDHCEQGVCVGNEPVVCHTPTCATSSSCVPGEGCVPEWKEAGASCELDNPCVAGASCSADHACTPDAFVSCNDDNPCTADTCVPDEGGCVHEPVDGPCDDGNACTVDDACQDGSCEPGTTGPDCDDGDACTVDSCDPDVGCVHEPIAADGCDDGDPCTESLCSDGGCVHEPYCEGSATSCGCSECTDCTAQDGWYDDGEAEPCCDDGEVCSCQPQEHRVHDCEGTECTYEITDERTKPVGCEDCGGEEAGPWSDCVTDDACAQIGERCREVTTHACEGGACQASTTEECETCTVDCEGWGLERVVSEDSDNARHVAWHDDTPVFALAYRTGSPRVYLVDADDGSVEVLDTGLDHSTQGLDFAANGDWLAVTGESGGGDRGVRIFDWQSHDQLASFLPVTNWALGEPAFSRDSEHVAWGRGNGQVRVYRTSDWSHQTTFSGSDWRSYWMDYSQSWFAHTNDDGVYVYDADGYEQLQRFEDGDSNVLALSRGDAWIAYRSVDTPSELIVREGGSWTHATTLSESDQELQGVDFTGDGAYVAYSQGEAAYVRSTGDWSLVATLDCPSAVTKEVAFGDDGSGLVVGTAGANAYVYRPCSE